MKEQTCRFLRWRFYFILLLFLIAVGALITRIVYLTVFDKSFLLDQGNARSLRIESIPAYRGMILDRHEHPLAISTPVDSVWVNPQDFSGSNADILKLSHFLAISSHTIHHILRYNKHREFAYLKRRINPELAQKIQSLAIPGIYLKQEYRRYYPAGEVLAQVLGFTNVDDQGQEGLELAFNSWLKGAPGKERVVKDRYGHVVAILSQLKAAKPGHDLILSIDSRLQFLAYRVLKKTVENAKAQSGSIVILNPKDGEILAIVNQPSYNPNNRPAHPMGSFRNRAITDMFEPGSTMKAFSIASALDSEKYNANSIIDTNPGRLKIGKNFVYDDRHENHGKLTVTQVLQKSSNIGVAKMTLSLPADHFIRLLRRVGFGERTTSNFPGESSGRLIYPDQWRPFVLATLAFGYGISVTPLQLARAYSVVANHGLRCPVTFLKRETSVFCPRAMDEKAADSMLTMLQSVVQKGGTGWLAHVPHYKVAGKTGTADIAGKHGYDKTKHMASFVGIAPASQPKLVVAVVVRNPKTNYYGGVIAAPAFRKVMSGALHILNIAPDNGVKQT